MVRDGGEAWRPWTVIPRVAGGALSVPVVIGFVALGAAVLIGRSLREVVREGWALVPWGRGASTERERRDSDAA